MFKRKASARTLERQRRQGEGRANLATLLGGLVFAASPFAVRYFLSLNGYSSVDSSTLPWVPPAVAPRSAVGEAWRSTLVYAPPAGRVVPNVSPDLRKPRTLQGGTRWPNCPHVAARLLRNGMMEHFIAPNAVRKRDVEQSAAHGLINPVSD